MAVQILRNRLKFPVGWFKYPVPRYANYPNVSPFRLSFGATVQFTLAASPANHAVETFTAPNGKTFTFEILFPSAVASAGNIGVPLASGGGSTAAQVATALFNVMNAATVTPVGGVPTTPPWSMTQTAATQLRINYNIAGNDQGNSGALIASVDAITSELVTVGNVVVARFGRNYAVLPGT